MKRYRPIWLVPAALAILLLAGGISYAWFSQNAALTTLMEILPPDSISIIPINSKDGSAMTLLDLDFKDRIDKKDEDGTIHIIRPICIESTSPVHQLEVAHTTNLKQLNFKIYPAIKAKDENNAIVFKYFPLDKEGNPVALSGDIINQDTSVDKEKVAKKERLNNYNSTDDVADVHAYPLYWLAKESAMSGYETGRQLVESEASDPEYDPVTQKEKVFYSTYYLLEISWKEETKETDLFYVMAQNIDVSMEGGGT